MFLGWTLFPLVLLLVSYGLGLGLARLAGGLPRGLLLPLGFAAAIVVSSFFTQYAKLAPAASPVVLVLAVLGVVFGKERRASLPDPWAIGAGVAAFLIFAAPTLLSGNGTFAGFIRLDDTATWWLMADRAMEHGRDITGIQPSSYNAVLNDYIPTGYPLGAFMPLGLGHELSGGVDIAFGFQATLALIAGFLALTLTEVVGPLVESPRTRALIAAVGAQGTMLFSYAQWGAIKEATAALLVASVAASMLLLAPSKGREEEEEFSRAGVLDSARRALPIGVACASVTCTLSAGGAVWILPVGGIALLACRHPLKRYVTGIPFILGFSLLGSIPAIALYSKFVKPTTGASNSVLRANTELGNLIKPLKLDQAFGVWLSGDFRVAPTAMAMTTLLITLVIIGGVAGVGIGLWKKGGPIVGYAAGGFLACAVLVWKGSPWLDAKAMATASPMVLTAALTALAVAWASKPQALKIGAAVLGGFVGLGVVWSNALVYGQSFIAPKAQISDLHTIGTMLKGKGPTLMNEYEPYGARHFLRDAGGEGASERRNRVIPLRDGTQLAKSAAADVTAFDPASLAEYRSLVVRKDPLGSRPPALYSLKWSGHAYEVWQRAVVSGAPALPTGELEFGSLTDPAAVPDCTSLQNLGAAVPGGTLKYVVRAPLAFAGLSSGTVPQGWVTTGDTRVVLPKSDGTLIIPVNVPANGRYRLWLGGSSQGKTSLSVDGRSAGSVRDVLNNQGGSLEFGTLALTAGVHQVKLVYDEGSLRPGSRGQDVSPLAFGPLVVAPANDPRAVQSLPAGQAASLCGKRLDWVESYAAGS